MSNIFIGQIKDYLKNYYNRALGYQNQIDANNQKYSAEFAEEANAAVIENAKSAYEKAKQNINSVFEDVRSCLAYANFPNVESLTADRMLFSNDCSIQLTPNEVRSYIERYRSNPTMLRMIHDWIEAQHDSDMDYTSIRINLPADQLKTYKMFADSALSLIDSIYTDPNNFTKVQIDAFADENFASELYSVIGSGMSLVNYKNSRIPESASHCFDNVTLMI